MLTLTLAHGTDPLSTQLDRLYASFRRLRQREAWKANVKAGAAACEVKLGKDGKWHVHLHVLIVGQWWHQREISQEWLAVTGDSRIVDIRPMPTAAAVHYAAKYLGKSVDAGVEHEFDRFVEAIKAMHGRRLLIVVGEWIGKLSEKTDETPEEIETRNKKSRAWVSLGGFEMLRGRAQLGCRKSKGILDELRDQWKNRRDEDRRKPPDKPRVVD